jgi:hypothetical protein
MADPGFPSWLEDVRRELAAVGFDEGHHYAMDDNHRPGWEAGFSAHEWADRLVLAGDEGDPLTIKLEDNDGCMGDFEDEEEGDG